MPSPVLTHGKLTVLMVSLLLFSKYVLLCCSINVFDAAGQVSAADAGQVAAAEQDLDLGLGGAQHHSSAPVCALTGFDGEVSHSWRRH